MLILFCSRSRRCSSQWDRGPALRARQESYQDLGAKRDSLPLGSRSLGTQNGQRLISGARPFRTTAPSGGHPQPESAPRGAAEGPPSCQRAGNHRSSRARFLRTCRHFCFCPGREEEGGLGKGEARGGAGGEGGGRSRFWCLLPWRHPQDLLFSSARSPYLGTAWLYLVPAPVSSSFAFPEGEGLRGQKAEAVALQSSVGLDVPRPCPGFGIELPRSAGTKRVPSGTMWWTPCPAPQARPLGHDVMDPLSRSLLVGKSRLPPEQISGRHLVAAALTPQPKRAFRACLAQGNLVWVSPPGPALNLEYPGPFHLVVGALDRWK